MKMAYTVILCNGKKKTLNFDCDLIFILYVENSFTLDATSKIIAKYKTDFLEYIGLKYLIKMEYTSKKQVTNNEIKINNIEKFKKFLLTQKYTKRLDRLHLNSYSLLYSNVLYEYMDNLVLKNKKYEYINKTYIEKYPIDYITNNDDNHKISTNDYDRFLQKNKLYLLTPKLFYNFYLIISKKLEKITDNTFISMSHRDRLVIFIFDHVRIKIHLIYKNINPKKIFNKYFSLFISSLERIEKKIIFKHLSKFYSICVYEYFPDITSYINLNGHISNYLMYMKNDYNTIN